MTLRPATDSDRAFFLELYVAIRRVEFEPLGWTDAQLRSLLERQFLARETHYASQFERLERSVILVEGADVGRLDLNREPAAVRVVDIAILPARQSQGIGRTVLKSVIEEAQKAGRGVCLRAGRDNPRACSLYRSLGFRTVARESLHEVMERRGSNATPANLDSLSELPK